MARETRADATGTQGHVAEPREPCVRHRWRTGRGHVVGGYMVHADACEGHHVAGGSASEGPTG